MSEAYRNYKTNYKGEVFYWGSAILGALVFIPLGVWVLGTMFGTVGAVVGFALGLWLTIWGAYGKPPKKWRDDG